MPAYVVLACDRIRDADALAAYKGKASVARVGHALTPRAFYGRVRSLEGPETEGAVILEFPSFEDAEAWYDSPLYREALVHRLQGADYRVFIVDGVPG